MKNCNGGAGNLSKVPGVDLLGRVWKGGGGVGGPFKQSVSQLPHLQIMHKPPCLASNHANLGLLSCLVHQFRVLPYIFNIVHAMIISAEHYTDVHAPEKTLVLGVFCR